MSFIFHTHMNLEVGSMIITNWVSSVSLCHSPYCVAFILKVTLCCIVTITVPIITSIIEASGRRIRGRAHAQALSRSFPRSPS